MPIARRDWVPEPSEALVQSVALRTANEASTDILARVEALAVRNRHIHERECFNLNPATNVMNPRAEALLSSRLGSRPSLGYPGDKYEMGLEAIEEIEIIAAELAAEVFEADFVEIRVPSGAMANLFGFMATTKPGDTVIVPSVSIGGHVTHHAPGAAGRYGLRIIAAPVLADGYTVDIAGIRALAVAERPRLITIGGSLNLFEHPVAELRAIADEVGAWLMFDAAHQCGIIAGKAWTNPLKAGAHFMTMSTYKSLGGPAGGLIVTNDKTIAERLDAIAYPAMTANFDAAKSAAWRSHCSIGAISAGLTPKRWCGCPQALPKRWRRGTSRCFRPGTALPPRTSSPSKPAAMAAARWRRKSCAKPGSSPAASACRSPRSPAT